MSERSSFDYALVRVVPRIERGEQLNVGVQYLDANGNEIASNYDGSTAGCAGADLLVASQRATQKLRNVHVQRCFQHFTRSASGK